MAFNFSKKGSVDLLWGGIWKTEFDKGVLLKAFCFFGNSKKIFESLFMASLQAFLVKLHIIDLSRSVKMK